MSRNRCINMLKMDIRIIVLSLLTVLISSCASTKGYYGRAEMTVAVSGDLVQIINVVPLN